MNTSQRLAAIEIRQAEIVTLLQTVRDQLDKQAENDEEIRRAIFGDGNDRQGLVVRLDRLEQTNKTLRWVMHSALATVIGLVVHAVWSHVR